MKTISFKPDNVCSREMILDIDDDGVIVSAKVIGGCMGNLQGLCRLIEGMKSEQVIAKLQGIKCRGSRTGETSCPDQLALGLRKAF